MEELNLPESLYEDYTTYAPLSNDAPPQKLVGTIGPQSFTASSSNDAPPQKFVGVIGAPVSSSNIAPPQKFVGVIGAPSSFTASSSNTAPPQNFVGIVGAKSSFTASFSNTAAPRNNVGVIGGPSSFTASSSNTAPPRNNFGVIGTRSSFTAVERVKIERLIESLNQPQTRANAISELYNVFMTHKEGGPELGLLLWNSEGTAFSLLQEILSVSPPNMSMEESERICSALLLIKCIASHPDTKMELIKAHIPVCFYPYMNISNQGLKQFDKLRLTGLAVIAQLLKEPGPHAAEIVHYLLEIDTVSLCLPSMILGEEHTKTLAALVLGKILGQNEGKAYFGLSMERFFVMSKYLSKVVSDFERIPPPALLKYILICYRGLAEIPRCREILMRYYPMRLKDFTYLNFVCDNTTRPLADQVMRSLIVGQQVQHRPMPDQFTRLGE